MRAFYLTSESKESALARAQAYREHERFHAFGQHIDCDGSRGSLLGLMYKSKMINGEIIEQDLPDVAERVHNIPRDVASIAQVFFSGLYCAPDKTIFSLWPERFYDAIPQGADLTKCADNLAMMLLGQPEWISAYADEKGNLICGYLHGIFTLRREGIDMTKRLDDCYHDHFHKMHHTNFHGQRHVKNYALTALRAATQVNKINLSSWNYFIKNACNGSAVYADEPAWQRCIDLSDQFINIIKESV